MSLDPHARDLTRTTLVVLTIGALIVTTTWIVLPFLSAFLWAATIVISTWPLLLRLQARLRGSRGLATAVMTLGLLLVLLIPLGFAVGALVLNIDAILAWVSSLDQVALPKPPGWLAHVPLFGAKLTTTWRHLISQGPSGVAAQVLPYAGSFLRWFASNLGGIGAIFLQFLITVIISGVFYSSGEAAASAILRFARRLAGPTGERVAIVAASSVRGVAMGVVGTAIVQTVVSGIGLLLVSFPAAPLVTAGTFFLCLAQIGPIPILLPAVIWNFSTGHPASGWVLLVFMLVAGTIDNVVRPILIRKGADLPILVIFLGVVGGMLSWGIVGVFVGPVILAVAYTLLGEWVDDRRGVPAAAAAATAEAGR